MTPDGPTEDEIEALLAGRPLAETPDEMSTFVDALRTTYGYAREVPVGRTLAEFIEVLDLDAEEARSDRPSRRIVGVGAVATTVLGKLVLGASMAAATIGGVHMVRLADVPLLGERAPVVVEEPPPAATSSSPPVESVAPTVDTRPAREASADCGSETTPTSLVAPLGTGDRLCRADGDRPGVNGQDIADNATNGNTPGVNGQDIADNATNGNTPGVNGQDIADNATNGNTPGVNGQDIADNATNGNTPGVNGQDIADNATNGNTPGVNGQDIADNATNGNTPGDPSRPASVTPGPTEDGEPDHKTQGEGAAESPGAGPPVRPEPPHGEVPHPGSDAPSTRKARG